MSFDSLERSRRDGRPVRLYEFTRGTTVWRFASADRNIDHPADPENPFAALAINDDGIRQTGQASADQLVITAPVDFQVARLYRGLPPSTEIAVVVYDLHFDDPDGEAVVSWVGSIAHVRWPGVDRCELTCSPLGASMDMPGLRLTYQRGCPHSLGGRGCWVDLELYKVQATILSMNGATITVATVPPVDPEAPEPLPAPPMPQQLPGGFIQWDLDGEPERRGIVGVAGNVLSIMAGTVGLEVGQLLWVYPGCPGTMHVCDTVYNNHPNHGGIPHLPGRSPFDGNPVF